MTENHAEPSRAFYTKAQLAVELQLSKRSIENLMRRHVIPFCKVGRIVRFSLPRVQQALERYVQKEAVVTGGGK